MMSTPSRKLKAVPRVVKKRGLVDYFVSAGRRVLPNQASWLEKNYANRVIRARYRWWRMTNPGTKVVFITFADGNQFTADRICAEAMSLSIFDRVIAYGPSMLEKEFLESHKEHFAAGRGFGFWVWKPRVILTTLEALNDGDVVFYADAGCTVNKNEKTRMLQLLLEIGRQKDGLMIAANKYSQFPVKKWTKADLFDHFGFLGNEELASSQQLEAGRVGIVRSAQNLEFVREWCRVASDLHLIDDSPSVLPNDPDFIEHRHDQSIFSMLLWNRHYLTGLEDVLAANRIRAPLAVEARHQ